jgi:hypothetical protein
VAGKTAGGVRFSLVYLYQKEKKDETIKIMTQSREKTGCR